MFPPIGSWREHLPYQGTIDVTASGKKIYAATTYSLFSVDIVTKEIERISKVAGLSETGVNAIEYDGISGKLYVAYTNSNIDVLDQKGIHNIPELKRENISGDKNIYQIYPDNTRCYLSTGLGIIVLDAEKLEVTDSWFIGNTGGYVKTNGFTKNNGFFYAASEEGLKKIAVSNNNPADFHNWQLVSGTNGLSASACKAVVSFQGKTIAVQNDSVFIENGTSWTAFFSNGWPIVSIKVSENKLLVCQRQSNGNAQVVVLSETGAVQKTLQQANVISDPKKGISVNNEYWIADLNGGLSHWTGNNFETYKLNSPIAPALAAMTSHKNILYAAAGNVNDSWNYQFNRGGIFKLDGGYWTNYNQYVYSQLDSLMDFVTIAVDPRDESVWAGSFGGGLLHIKTNDQLEIFKQNSPIRPTVGDPGSYRIAGLAFDAENNLWMSNFGTERELLVLKNDGSWQSFTVPFLLNFNTLTQILIDDNQLKWIASPLGNGLIVFDDNNTIDNPNDDRWKFYRIGTGSGNLPSNEVLTIAKDKSGYIWVGTNNGIAVIQCPQEVFTTGCDAIWPVIREGNFANYLFKGQEVRSIAVDGADRKWIAAADGVWLVSPDGDKIISHFTEDNSPLLSNDVKTVSVNGETGEVFFGTAKGIVSFRGGATEAAETKTNVLVFPNPVPPAYNGTIGIRGLPENGVVKITETNGRLVFQGRSLGGQMVWNGKDYSGRPAASGVYLVIAEEKIVAKIVLIGK
jgi:hypothetical protein